MHGVNTIVFAGLKFLGLRRLRQLVQLIAVRSMQYWKEQRNFYIGH